MLDVIPATTAGGEGVPGEAPAVVSHVPEFTGRAGEYFGIWFVNLLLSIVTLGIYSAWAKVRTERYFYANTRLAGASFEYLANPIAILKGRLIAYAVVIALALSARFSPTLYLLLFFLVAILVPALIVWSLRFRARNSAWRGLSFRFDESAGAAYGPFMLWGWLTGLSMSLLYPVMKKRQHAFVVEGHRYGTKRFAYAGDTGAYYVPYAIAAVAWIVLFAALIFTIASFAGDAPAVRATGQQSNVLVVAMAVFYLAFFALMAFLRTRYTNLLWNSTSIGPHRFRSTLRARDVIWLYASNIVVIVFTLGLAVPWAMVRLARYRAAHFVLDAEGSLEEFVAASENQYGAGSAELIDALDMGVDIGL